MVIPILGSLLPPFIAANIVYVGVDLTQAYRQAYLCGLTGNRTCDLQTLLPSSSQISWAILGQADGMARGKIFMASPETSRHPCHARDIWYAISRLSENLLFVRVEATY